MAATTAPSASRAVALDLVLGPRPAVACHHCGRHLPAIGPEQPMFEVETEAGDTLCMFCVDKQHRGVRLAALLLNHALDERRAGNHQAAIDTIAAIVSGIELLDEDTPRPARRPPIRHQPIRTTRRSRKR